MDVITTNEASLILNDGLDTIPKGAFRCRKIEGKVEVTYISSRQTIWSLDLPCSVDGVVYTDALLLCKKLSSFKRGGANGIGVREKFTQIGTYTSNTTVPIDAKYNSLFIRNDSWRGSVILKRGAGVHSDYLINGWDADGQVQNSTSYSVDVNFSTLTVSKVVGSSPITATVFGVEYEVYNK